jgi:hypothetical protein
MLGAIICFVLAVIIALYPKSYQLMVKRAREDADAENDLDSLIKHGGFKPIYPEDEPSEADPKTKQDQEA